MEFNFNSVTNCFNKIKYSLKNITKHLKLYIFLLFFLILVITGIYFILPSITTQQNDSLIILSGLSTFFIAVFTLIYVYISSEQVNIMIKQVEEMKKDRLLQSQPLLWLTKIQFKIQKPRLLTRPPFKEYLIRSRYCVNFSVKNIGLNPAVLIAVSGDLYIVKTDYKFKSSSDRIEVLQYNQEIGDDVPCSILFWDDRDNILLTNLMPFEDSKHAIFEFIMIYKNILGACFSVSENFALYVKSKEDLELIKNWLSEIAAFNIKHKQELEKIKELGIDKKIERDKIKDPLKIELATILKGEDIELNLFPLPDSMLITPISNEEYTQLLKSMRTAGTPTALVKKWGDGKGMCLHPEMIMPD